MLAKAPALGWHWLLRLNPAAYRGLNLPGRLRPPLAHPGIKGLTQRDPTWGHRRGRTLLLGDCPERALRASPSPAAHPPHAACSLRDSNPRLQRAKEAGEAGGGAGKWALGGGRCCPGDWRALPGGNFGVAERRSEGRQRVPGRAGLLRGPMAQYILALAAEEAPERLQEALQSLGEDEVRGRPAGWALCAGTGSG